MTLLEEKKLVAEKLMGWSLDGNCIYHHFKEPNHCHSSEKHTNDNRIHWSKWNPQDNVKSKNIWWNDIFDNMDSDQKNIYYNRLRVCIPKVKPSEGEIGWHVHTAKPAIMWEALVSVLEEAPHE